MHTIDSTDYLRGFLDGFYGLLGAMRTSERPELAERHIGADARAVADRHNWRCTYCGSEIDPDLQTDGPLALTVDATDRTEGDARPAHRGCQQKGGLRLEKRVDLVLLGRASGQLGGNGLSDDVFTFLQREYPWMTH
jgi:hypothetical protein